MLREIAATYLCACARVREVHVCGCKRAHTHTHWVQRMRQSIRMHAPLLEHQLAVCCILEPHGRLDLRAPPPPVRHNFPRVLCPPHPHPRVFDRLVAGQSAKSSAAPRKHAQAGQGQWRRPRTAVSAHERLQEGLRGTARRVTTRSDARGCARCTAPEVRRASQCHALPVTAATLHDAARSTTPETGAHKLAAEQELDTGACRCVLVRAGACVCCLLTCDTK